MGEIAKFIGYVVIFFLVVGYFAEREQEELGQSASKADCRVLSVSQHEEAFYIKDDLDFGYTVQTRIQNAGEKGPLTITARLSTSEGTFERTQDLVFNANQESDLSYQFAEPSINATGIQSRVLCSPSSNK